MSILGECGVVGITWLLRFEVRAHILCSGMFSDFGAKYVSPRGRMSSKQTCPDEASVVSLEPWTTVEVHLAIKV